MTASAPTPLRAAALRHATLTCPHTARCACQQKTIHRFHHVTTALTGEGWTVRPPSRLAVWWRVETRAFVTCWPAMWAYLWAERRVKT